MNRKRKLGMFTNMTIALVMMLGVSSANADNGVQFSEFDVAGDFYVDCLNEYVFFEEHVRISNHEFVTPSGTYHLVDNWTFTLTGLGESTGRLWAGVLPSPTTVNIGPAETTKVFIKGVVRPLTDDTPPFFWDLTYQATVNANGELVFERGEGVPVVRCLGKNRN